MCTKIVIFSNILNNHQCNIADELWDLTNHSFYFVETKKMDGDHKKGDTNDYSNCPYLIRAWESGENKRKAIELALSSKVAIFLSECIVEYGCERLKLKRLTFELSERWLKKGWINYFSPNLWKHQLFYYKYGCKAPLYMLCTSAYTPNDYYSMSSFKGRCYKWGYFTKVDDNPFKSTQKDVEPLSFMWCSRFISWKHPELVIELAERLKQMGYKFMISMYGSGPLKKIIENEITKRNLGEYIQTYGNIPNMDLIKKYRTHTFFLLTSDRNEGWGAVANEAMSNGCILIASNKVGSVPYLVKNKVNACIYEDQNIDSLYKVVLWLIEHEYERKQISSAAYTTMSTIWNAKHASRTLMELIANLTVGEDTNITSGPCSKAIPMNYNECF